MEMTLRKITEILDAQVLTGSDLLDKISVERAGAADLMSDVLAYSHAGALLLTGLANAQSLHTADMAELKAIVYVRGKQPNEETIRLAASRLIPLLKTELGMFESCGQLHRAGLMDNGKSLTRPGTKG